MIEGVVSLPLGCRLTDFRCLQKAQTLRTELCSPQLSNGTECAVPTAHSRYLKAMESPQMLTQRPSFSTLPLPSRLALVGFIVLLAAFNCNAQPVASNSDQKYEYKETRELVALANDAADLVRTKGKQPSLTFVSMAAAGGRQTRTYLWWMLKGTCSSIPIGRWKVRTSLIRTTSMESL